MAEPTEPVTILTVAAVEVSGTEGGRPVRLLVCPFCYRWRSPEGAPMAEVPTFRRAERAAFREHIAGKHGKLTLAEIGAG